MIKFVLVTILVWLCWWYLYLRTDAPPQDIYSSGSNKPSIDELRKYFGVPDYEISESAAAQNLVESRSFLAGLGLWLNRSDFLRKQLSEQLNYDDTYAVIDGALSITQTVDFEDYAVDSLTITENSNILVSGNLYRPQKISQYPLIMSPHDHSDQGRFDADLQKRCATLARMGALVFTWDMVGWGESGGEHETVSVKAEQISITSKILTVFLGSQYVDSSRIAFVGSSGGAALGMHVLALDRRYHVGALVSMISSLCVGYCHCEISGFKYNTKNYRTNNIELTGLIAPKPLLIISNSKDWTRVFPRLGLPLLKEIYGLFNFPDQLENVHMESEGHEFSSAKRTHVYDFLIRKFGLIRIESVGIESLSRVLARKDLEARPFSKIRASLY